jgi:ketosteroid isomerase-like protein
MSRENVESMRAVVEAFNRRDIEALKALLVADAEIVPIRAAMEGTVYRGPDAAEQWFAAVDESWEELHVEVEEARDCGDRVLGLGRIHGRGRASGAPIDVESASVAYFGDDGLITTIHNYTNRDEALKAAGLSGSDS